MKLKHLLRYPSRIRTARSLLKRGGSEHSSARGVIGIDLYTEQLLFDCGRHLACLAATAQLAEYEIHLRCSKWLLAAIAHKPLGKSFLSLGNVRWLSPNQIFPGHAVVLSDVAEHHALRVHAGQHLIHMLIGCDVIPGTMVMPYPMHPRQISDLAVLQRDELRRQEKRGVFFAGNQKQRYGRSAMQDRFGVISRLEIVSTLQEAFSDRVCTERDNVSDGVIHLLDTSINPIALEDWVPTLSQHQFFVCCPGASQPMCHNVIEAMSVGVIPIIEYGDRFHPELRDGETCIAFHGRQGLVKAVERAAAMPAQDRQRISRNVYRYFDRNLDGIQFMKKVFQAGRSRSEACVSMPFHESNFFDPTQIAAVEFDAAPIDSADASAKQAA
ncbi:hypothetical protein [Rhodopirellula sp. MGV]|uniref:hypothetical protein n=1 Tax=Rhodopirellula sp. MGV TaxID=2023130 RepID=UPI000B964457|nr:hypothetical protein [Rhodopirellula sp. MGV]PNY36941.1 hypothetical protein C2E31_10010 [Rhodopirellula baltica]